MGSFHNRGVIRHKGVLMKDNLKVLFVEDRASHIADLNAMLADELPRLPIHIIPLLAENLQWAMPVLEKDADGVVTDVFFPADAGGDPEQPNGQLIVEACLRLQKPVVWVTSTYHHGRKTNPVSEWGRQRGLEMFDCYKAGHGEAAHKPWKKALYGLLYTIVAVEMGKCLFIDGKIMYRPSRGSDMRAAINFGDVRPFLEAQSEDSNNPVIMKMVELGFKLAT